MLRGSWIAASLLFMALATWWYAELIGTREKPIKGQSPRSIDYYVKGFTKTVMDANGNPKHMLIADRLNHFRDDNMAELLKPRLKFLDTKRPSWVIRSETGFFTSHAKEVFLGGDVKIERPGDEESPPIKIITKELTVKLNENYAESETYTEIVRLDHRISATGARVYFGYPARVYLNSAVRGYYKVR